MRLRRCDVVIVSLVIQLCFTTVVYSDDDDELKARDWLAKYYDLAEQRLFAWQSANWNFSINITDENKQRMVSCRILTTNNTLKRVP